jgi:glycosyltransferase involved in cell wall biosynthesis
MHIEFVAQPFDRVRPPGQNSIGLIVHNTASRLAREHRVAVHINAAQNISPGPDGASDVEYKMHSTQIDDALRRLASRYPNWISHPRFVASRWHYRSYAMQVARSLRRSNCDWVHILNFSQFAPVVRRQNRRTRIALEMQCEWLTQFDRSAVARRLQHVDVITGVSDYITDKVREAFPEARDRCHTIYNGFDVGAFASAMARDPGQPPRVLFVGRTSPEKGVHTLIEAMRAVVLKVPGCTLDLVGDNSTLPAAFIVSISDEPKVQALSAYYDGTICSDYQEHLRLLAAAPELAGKVRLVGPVPQSALPEYYRSADVLVNPSFSESFGMTVVEAMAAGRPVVATRVGGMTETVESGRTGYLVEPGDVDGLAAAIVGVLARPDRGAALGLAGRERALRLFSWEARVHTLAGLYERLGT